MPVLLAGQCATFAQAQAPSSDSAITLGNVEVRHAAKGPLQAHSVLTSVDVMGRDKVEDKNVLNSWELLGQMPGVQLTETRQGAESGKATFRAFNGEGYINGIKTLIDGIPSNVNSGNQRFIDMVFPLEVEYIEVVRGTNDPRYGLHNIGGNLNFATRQGGDYLESRLTYGSFDTREGQVAFGKEGGGFAQNYFVGIQASDGYRDHDTSRKHTLSGKWFYTSDDQALRAGLIARSYHHEADEPGFLTARQIAADRHQSPAKNANDGDDRDMWQLSAHVDLALSDRLSLSTKLYANSYRDDRKVTFSDYPVGNAPRQRRQWDEKQLGWIGSVTWIASDWITLEAGANIEQQDNEYRRYRYGFNIPTEFDAAPARVQNDDRYTLDNLGGYVQAVLRPFEALKVVPAYRVDRFSGDTQLPGGVSAPLQRYGWIRQPKLSVVYAIGPKANIYANWGRTFQVLTGSTAPAYLSQGQQTYRPSINTGSELGLKFKPAPGAEARLAVWRQDATDEVANMPATGTSVGLGQTRRQGLDLQVSSRVRERWTLWASHALQEAKVVSAYTVGGVPLAGKEVFATPRCISNLGADYQWNDRLKLGLQARMQGDYYIEELNRQGKYGGYKVLDVNARYQASERLSVDFQIKNLANQRYEYVWYDNFFWGGNDQAMFSAAPGRSAYLSLNFKM
ncbi:MULTISPECIES: TonB-dependent receptor [unclassified Lysobacter]|uniref:TonB-dependent receptor n=1 Tax=unclassified Lysobacter TaxID=2635362 RepID=UPI001BE74C96|nr:MULTISPECIES: TonB-dependent receptor [unclassified Lysobacter]MBT2748781.1 TonB-dependent receptor [Lysobacter sp. ISL-42]MBT2753131.1 TonB-dependent receptor [Lysobacter sp. ISL-50]MBT2779818.1 TonB-dependent receptor [Lysobacter sp. ISL-54]MBT2782408.1 TonB-dependent receptor [Lysobacter sp. ISL-52]